ARRPAVRRPRRSKKSAPNPLEAWTENLSKSAQSVREALKSGDLGERARQQAEQFVKTVQDGLQSWQRLWQPPAK
ncbi:MAG: hypothetical protein ACREQB_00255, partial [Candidatus Binataceae bacterium]